MLCSNCGFETPAAHRFCGMCGTPLPQSPITAPGAQSTVGFTRLPVEGAQRASSTSLSGSSQEASIAVDAQAELPSRSESEPNYFSQAERAESLEQFIAGFRYTPPVAEEEVTMTGDKPVLDPGNESHVPPTPVSVSGRAHSRCYGRASRHNGRGADLASEALPAEEAPLVGALR